MKKKILCLLLALVLSVSFCLPAAAAKKDNSICVDANASEMKAVKEIADMVLSEGPYETENINTSITTITQDGLDITVISIDRQLENTALTNESNGVTDVEKHCLTKVALVSARTSGSQTVEEFPGTDFYITNTMYYDKRVIMGNDCYKITSSYYSVECIEPRYSVTNVNQYVYQVGQSYSDPNSTSYDLFAAEDFEYDSYSSATNQSYYAETGFTNWVDSIAMGWVFSRTTVYFIYGGVERNFYVLNELFYN